MSLARLKLLRTWSSCPCRISMIECLPAFFATWSPSMLIPRPPLCPLPCPAAYGSTSHPRWVVHNRPQWFSQGGWSNHGGELQGTQCYWHLWCAQPDVLTHSCNAQRPVLLSHEFRQGGQEVQQGRVQVGIPHPVPCFHLLYHSLRKWAGWLLKSPWSAQGRRRQWQFGTAAQAVPSSLIVVQMNLFSLPQPLIRGTVPPQRPQSLPTAYQNMGQTRSIPCTRQGTHLHTGVSHGRCHRLHPQCWFLCFQ